MRFGRQSCCLALGALALVAGVSAAAGGAASTPRGWHALSVGKVEGFFPLGRASGRVWFVSEGFQGAYTVWSARVAGGRLTTLVSTSEGKSESTPDSFIFGSSLVNCCVGTAPTSSSSAPLLASGKVGAWTPLAGDPEKVTQDALTPAGQGSDGRWRAQAAITVGGRTIWAIQGHTCPPEGKPHQCTINGGGVSWFAVCCTPGGAPVDLSSLLTNQFKGTGTDPAFGRDKQGRLWLAWLDAASSKPGAALKLVQLDPNTLSPSGVRKLDHVLLYGIGQPSAFSLACAASCRLVYQALPGAYSWGGGKPIRLWADNLRKGTGGSLLGASLRAGGLDVANYGNKNPKAPGDGQRVTLKHGDALGRHLRARRTVAVPLSLPDGPTHYFFPIGVPEVMFSPTGLVVLALYQDERPGGVQTRLLGAALHG